MLQMFKYGTFVPLYRQEINFWEETKSFFLLHLRFKWQNDQAVSWLLVQRSEFISRPVMLITVDKEQWGKFFSEHAVYLAHIIPLMLHSHSFIPISPTLHNLGNW